LNASVQTVRWRTPSARLARGSGSTSIIGLNAIRREAGERWEMMREPIMAKLEALLRQRLSPEDFFVPVGETSYLVVMPHATQEDGQICCLRIAYELHTGLLGPCSLDHLNIAQADAPSDDVLEMQPLGRDELVLLAKKAELDLLPLRSANAYDGSPGCAAPSRVELGFLPVWDAQYQVIRAYDCLPSGIRCPKEEQTPALLAREMAHASLTVLRLTVETLERHLARGERFLLNMPVSYEMLSAPVARMEFVSACRELPCTLRPYLAFEIGNLPVGVPQSRLLDLVSAIRCFCGMVFAKVPSRMTNFAAFRNVGLKALGIGLRGIAPSDYGFEIDKIATEAKRLGISAYIDGVPNAQVIRYALDYGIQWMSGPAIAAAVGEPGPLKRLSAAQLLHESAGA
jgi:hypothetical protein